MAHRRHWDFTSEWSDWGTSLKFGTALYVFYSIPSFVVIGVGVLTSLHLQVTVIPCAIDPDCCDTGVFVEEVAFDGDDVSSFTNVKRTQCPVYA